MNSERADLPLLARARSVPIPLALIGGAILGLLALGIMHMLEAQDPPETTLPHSMSPDAGFMRPVRQLDQSPFIDLIHPSIETLRPVVGSRSR